MPWPGAWAPACCRAQRPVTHASAKPRVHAREPPVSSPKAAHGLPYCPNAQPRERQRGSTVGLLGFGAMRLPVVDSDQAAIDQPALDAMVDTAIASGVNYFDTAYPYHDGLSEVALGKSLARYPRDSYYLADKYPGHQIADSYNPAQIFEEQLAKCGVGHFDFYLLHNVYENSIDVYTDEKWGIADYFAEQKRLGRISHLGFSSHGRPDNLAAFLDYGARKYAALKEKAPEVAALFAGENIFEFCQIQLNYLDWTLQRAEEKCAMLENAGVPVVVMEPLRGAGLPNWNRRRWMRWKRPRPGAARWSGRSDGCKGSAT
ncbi:aldo/keto reductase [Parvibacter caecicola]|uniref:aldo/keto reductase n=1 Tax=Parvibacter caecicola TaxID=747645 RepID=UPI003C6DCC34